MNLEKLQKYIEKYRQRLMLLIYNDGFQTEVSNIRSSWSIPPNGYDSLESGVQRVKDQISEGRELTFLDEISNLVTTYNLKSSWDTAVMCYVLTDDENLMLASIVIPSEETISSESGSNEIKVTMDKFTSLEDVKAIWSEVNKIQKGLSNKQFSKQQVVQNIDRYVRVKQLQRNGLSHKEIAELLSNEFGEELSEEEIGRYIYRFNKLSSKYYDANHA